MIPPRGGVAYTGRRLLDRNESFVRTRGRAWLGTQWWIVLVCTVACDDARHLAARRFDTAGIAAVVAGCYALQTTTTAYVVQLSPARSGTARAAHLLAPASAASAGEWSWAPLDSTHFVVRWDGIDGGLVYTIARARAGVEARATFTSANTKKDTTMPAKVQPVGCVRRVG